MIASAAPLDVLVCTDSALAADAVPLFKEVHLLDPAAPMRSAKEREHSEVQLHSEPVGEALVTLGAELAGQRVLYALSAEHDPSRIGGIGSDSVLVIDGAVDADPGWLLPDPGRDLVELEAGVVAGPAALAEILGSLPAAEPVEQPVPTGANPAPAAAERSLERSQQLVAQLRDRNERLEQRIALLRKDLGLRRGTGRLGSALHRLRVLRARLRPVFGVRLGLLWHYRPRELRVPASYRRVAAPQPAPSISIVVPSLNQGEFLARTLDSVLDQGYPELELIVEDGGSSDATPAVLDAYRDRLAHVSSGPDGGQASAVNAGFARSQGEIMAWLNSDDMLLPGALAYVGRYFAEHPEVDVVYGHRVLIDSDDREIGRWVMPAHDDEILSWADYVPQETLFWRREAWDRVGGRLTEEFRFALDWDLLVRMREAGATTVRLPRFLGAFRVHEAQKSSAQVETLGVGEMNRLRRRIHGRAVSPVETRRAIRPYLRRHALLDKLHRLRLLRH